ncbi:MAG: GNAT family N-acetyltransferase [Chitinophagaceae bacterium]|nr:GNAT family N-acetyltransferase [Chitinophagaceae bacterium]
MIISEVRGGRDIRAFLELPKQLYRNDPAWIAPLDNEIESVFDPVRNSFFSHGTCTRWLLKNDDNAVIGRIAAFINHHHQSDAGVPTGGTGFFECIDDTEAAHLLFDTAAKWLQAKGMEAMDGPINFGENDKFWGLLVEGFSSPGYGMNYNPPFYQELFESYGFEKVYDQLTNTLDVTRPIPDRFAKIAAWVMNKKEYSFKHFSSSAKEKFFSDFHEIYNEAWSDFDNFHPIDMATIRESFHQMEPVMDQKIIWFAYHNEEPIAFVVCMPDINQVLKHLDGKMNLFSKLKFLWYKQTTTIDRIRIIVMGCKHKYQNHGIESALIRCLQEEILPRHTIREIELAWVGDFNKKMMAIHHATGAVPSKVHRTYRYIFNQDASFKDERRFVHQTV